MASPDLAMVSSSTCIDYYVNTNTDQTLLNQTLNQAKHDVDIARINRFIAKQQNIDHKAIFFQTVESWEPDVEDGQISSVEIKDRIRHKAEEIYRRQDVRLKRQIDREVTKVEVIKRELDRCVARVEVNKRKLAEISSEGEGMI